MIVPMKKYSFLVYHADYEAFLEKIREIGVIEVVESPGQTSDLIQERHITASRISDMIRMLKSRNQEAKTPDQLIDGIELINKIQELKTEQDRLTHYATALNKEISLAEPWGEFSPQLLSKIAKAGYKARFFSCAESKFDESWLSEYYIADISRKQSVVYFVLFQEEGQTIEIDAEEQRIPEHTVTLLRKHKEDTLAKSAAIDQQLDELAAKYLPELENAKLRVLSDAQYETVLVNTLREADEKLMVLHGFVPEPEETKLKTWLDESGFVYFADRPVPGDKVPVLLKNKKFANKFEALGELYSLPGYSELDLTPFFAPFYTIFFGFCLGDAGYGVLITLVALFAKRKVTAPLKPIASLVSYLGISTIVFGLISGTAFGINLYETNLPVYSQLQQMLKANNTDINNLLFILALILGGIQILFGMGIKAANEAIQFGFKYALGTIGWIVILLGIAIIGGISKLGGVPFETLKPALYAVLGIGGVLVLFFNSPGKSIFLNFGLGLWNSYNMVTGVLGDLLSYIRLFALGISSAILGFVFNSLALSVSGSVIGVFFMVIILVIGHSINIFMASLGSFVHPMRLTFVEFYKNAGFEGGGRKYTPFRKLI